MELLSWKVSGCLDVRRDWWVTSTFYACYAEGATMRQASGSLGLKKESVDSQRRGWLAELPGDVRWSLTDLKWVTSCNPFSLPFSFQSWMTV